MACSCTLYWNLDPNLVTELERMVDLAGYLGLGVGRHHTPLSALHVQFSAHFLNSAGVCTERVKEKLVRTRSVSSSSSLGENYAVTSVCLYATWLLWLPAEYRITYKLCLLMHHMERLQFISPTEWQLPLARSRVLVWDLHPVTAKRFPGHTSDFVVAGLRAWNSCLCLHVSIRSDLL